MEAGKLMAVNLDFEVMGKYSSRGAGRATGADLPQESFSENASNWFQIPSKQPTTPTG